MKLETILAFELEGHMKFQGLEIAVENKRGSVRSGVDKNGKPWRVEMMYPYGFIKGSKGLDKEHVDCYVGSNPHAKFAYVVHQVKILTGEFDEDKVMLGFNDAMQAKEAYLAHYDNPAYFGSMDAIPMAAFKKSVMATKKDPTQIRSATQMERAVSLYAKSAKITAAKDDVSIGDPVTVDGLQGRGVVVGVKGSRITVKFRSGVYVTRDEMFVHSMSENTVSRMFRASKEWKELEEGGPIDRKPVEGGSIKKQGTQYCVTSQNGESLGCYPSRESAQARLEGRPMNVDAGGDGSGCHGPNCGRPAKGVAQGHKPDRSTTPTRQERIDPRQTSLYGPGHEEELKQYYRERSGQIDNLRTALNKAADKLDAKTYFQHERAVAKFVGHAVRLLKSPDARALVQKAKDALATAKNNAGRNTKVATGDLGSALHYLRRASNASPLVEKIKMPKLGPEQLKLFSGGGAGTSGWQYGRRMPTGYVSPRTLSDFPKIPGFKNPSAKARYGGGSSGTGHIRPTPSFGRSTSKMGHRLPNPSFKAKSMKADYAGEPMAGNMAHSHIDPVVWFHPPSLTKRLPNEETRIPTDDPREKNDKFLDVTKRNSKDTQEQRMKLLKRQAPPTGMEGLPVRTTLLAPHTAAYMPGSLDAAAKKSKVLIRQRPARGINGTKKTSISYDRLGCV